MESFPALRCLPGFALLCLTFAGAATADEVTLSPIADATLYQPAAGDLANGMGDHLFVGNTVASDARRSVLRFDLTAVPPGSTIDGVELTLNMSRTIAVTTDVSLHRAASAWSEGPSLAPGEEGQGTAAMAGDVTWLHTSYDTELWMSPGGDFAASPSATLAVASPGAYTWGSTADLVADVQSWVDTPTINFGWMLVGNEAAATTAKRFDSRENPDPGVQPELRVVFTPSGLLSDIPTLDPRLLAVLAILLALAGLRVVSKV